MKTSNKLNVIDTKLLKTDGIFDSQIKLISENILKVIDMRALADYFRNKADMFATGEFWGKIMRASCMIYSYTQDAGLREIIDDAANDMISIQKENGDLSTVPEEKQPNGSCGSDLWERKYALMGLLSYYEATGSADALNAARRLALYTASQVGLPPKTPITQTGWAFCGIESSSILEVIMRTYMYTKDKELLDFGKYIIESGACSRENIFEAIKNGKSPYMIGNNGNPKESIAKAYEMMSCFEGLVEYYRATADTDALRTAVAFWDKVKEEEITLLGSGGADAPYNLGPGTGEQWNLTAKEQTNPDIDLMMETCVTVYWMRLSFNLLKATGNPKYADAIECSLYNAILGAIRPDGRFFEYFPRFNGKRNSKVNYSFNINGFDLSCCTANGPTGLAMFTQTALMSGEEGYALNFYESLKYEDDSVRIEVISDYPADGKAVVNLLNKSDRDIVLSLRVPGWTPEFSVQLPDREIHGTPGQYADVLCKSHSESVLKVKFSIPVVRHDAPLGSNRKGDNFEAYTYGAILLAQDDALSELVYPLDKKLPEEFKITKPDGRFFIAEATIGGKNVTFTDYMSSGKQIPDGEFMTWIPTV